MSTYWLDGLLVEIEFSVGARITIFRSKDALGITSHVRVTVEAQLVIVFTV